LERGRWLLFLTPVPLPIFLYTDEKKDHREFSIASSPQDEGILMVATRLGSPARPISAFKKSMTEVPLGTEFGAEGPYGMFTLHENTEKKAVFIAGGIGITPIRSIIKDATERKLPHNISLIYSNRNKASGVFIEDLQNWEKENQNFKLFLKWTEESGYAGASYIKECLGDLSNSIFYVVGPPAMVGGVTKTLEELKVSRDDIKFEEFTGY
jgi:ferredoxin-NADP reductase